MLVTRGYSSNFIITGGLAAKTLPPHIVSQYVQIRGKRKKDTEQFYLTLKFLEINDQKIVINSIKIYDEKIINCSLKIGKVSSYQTNASLIVKANIIN